MLGDTGVPHRDPFAKNAAAFLRNSCSWRSTAFSRRSRRSACSGVSPAAGRSVLSVSCCFQWRNWSGRIPSSRALSLDVAHPPAPMAPLRPGIPG
jgi:hypothetical protein